MQDQEPDREFVNRLERSELLELENIFGVSEAQIKVQFSYVTQEAMFFSRREVTRGVYVGLVEGVVLARNLTGFLPHSSKVLGIWDTTNIASILSSRIIPPSSMQTGVHSGC